MLKQAVVLVQAYCLKLIKKESASTKLWNVLTRNLRKFHISSYQSQNGLVSQLVVYVKFAILCTHSFQEYQIWTSD